MSLALIRSALVAMHSGLPNMGRVHGRERYAREEKHFRDLYTVSNSTDVLVGQAHVRGWHWSRVATSEALVSTATSVVKHRWQCRGYLSLVDEADTAGAFDGLVEVLAGAYRANSTLGGVADASPMDAEGFGVQVLDAGPVVFCGVLCHSARLQLTTWSYE